MEADKVMVTHMLEAATLRRASDIHMQPKKEQGEILFRVDGYLLEWQSCSLEQLQAMLAQLKYLAQMDIGEKRLPQDGSLQQTIDKQPLQLRLSTLPTINGEKLVIRLFPQDKQNLTLEHLGFTSQQFQFLEPMIQQPHGLLLVTGPTGSGKTTTMYTMLDELLKKKGKNICSLEDPVEIQVPSMTQVQINPQQGFTFANGLRAILRQDPDIIFVGEIRDEETAEIAIRAALTGHLVLTTLHTPDVIGAVARLLEMNIKPYYLASALIGVLTQRLFRLRCSYCEQGCYHCFYTGYFGRRAVFELLPIIPELKLEIRQGASEESLQLVAKQLNLAPMQHQMLQHVTTGLTTEKECLAFDTV